jgi:hypothetical protein
MEAESVLNHHIQGPFLSRRVFLHCLVHAPFADLCRRPEWAIRYCGTAKI